MVTDISEPRLKLASKFGADYCFSTKQLNSTEVASQIARQTDGHGVDVAFEVCGQKAVVDQAVESLRIGGRYLIAGLVTPGSDLDIDGNQLTRKFLTVKGIHNYKPEHLGKALRFLQTHWQKYPYAELLGQTFPLSQINEAVRLGASGRYIRVGIR